MHYLCLFASQGHLGHTAAAAAVGGLAGYMVGLAVRSTADLTQLACAQAAFTIFLINLGVLKIDWGRVRALTSCLLGLPLSLLKAGFARREEKRRRRESEKWEGRLPVDDGRGGRQWVMVNEHAAAGGGCGFITGLWVALKFTRPSDHFW